MSTTIDIRDLPTRLDEAINEVNSGHDVILTNGSRPWARLQPLPPSKRVIGLHPGAMEMAPDFDEPLDDVFWTGSS